MGPAAQMMRVLQLAQWDHPLLFAKQVDQLQAIWVAYQKCGFTQTLHIKFLQGPIQHKVQGLSATSGTPSTVPLMRSPYCSMVQCLSSCQMTTVIFRCCALKRNLLVTIILEANQQYNESCKAPPSSSMCVLSSSQHGFTDKDIATTSALKPSSEINPQAGAAQWSSGQSCCLTAPATGSILTSGVVCLHILPVCTFFLQPSGCLRVFRFPPTSQKHAGQQVN